MTDKTYGNSKFYITKLNPFSKSTFQKQSIKANAEVKNSVNLTNKYKEKAKNLCVFNT